MGPANFAHSSFELITLLAFVLALPRVSHAQTAQCVSTPGVNQALLSACEALKTQLDSELTTAGTVALGTVVTLPATPATTTGNGGQGGFGASSVVTMTTATGMGSGNGAGNSGGAGGIGGFGTQTSQGAGAGGTGGTNTGGSGLGFGSPSSTSGAGGFGGFGGVGGQSSGGFPGATGSPSAGGAGASGGSGQSNGAGGAGATAGPNGSGGTAGSNGSRSPSSATGNGVSHTGAASPEQNGASPNPSPDNGSSSSSSSNHYRNHVVIPAAVVGAFVGTLLLALLLLLLCICLRRRRKQKEEQEHQAAAHTGPEAAAFAALGGVGACSPTPHGSEKVGTMAPIAAASGGAGAGQDPTHADEKVGPSPFADPHPEVIASGMNNQPNTGYGTRSKAEAILGGGAAAGAAAGVSAAAASRPHQSERHPSNGERPAHELSAAPVPAASRRSPRTSISSKLPRMRQPQHYIPPPAPAADEEPPRLPRLSQELGTGTWFTTGDTPRSDSEAYPDSTIPDPFQTPSGGSLRSSGGTGTGAGMGAGAHNSEPRSNARDSGVIPGPWPGHNQYDGTQPGHEHVGQGHRPASSEHANVEAGPSSAPQDVPERSPDRQETTWMYPSPQEASAFDFDLANRQREARRSIPRKPVGYGGEQ